MQQSYMDESLKSYVVVGIDFPDVSCFNCTYMLDTVCTVI